MSAYAITYFILSRLSEATGSGTVPPPPDCANLAFANENRDLCGSDSFTCSTDRACCSIDHFVVRSMTPNTPIANLGTRMNNTVIRVIFSHSLRPDILAEDVLTIEHNGDVVSEQDGLFVFQYLDGSDRSVVEARPIAVDGRIPLGHYEVTVNDTVRDMSSQSLENTLSCGVFDQSVSFDVDEETEDREAPLLGALNFDGITQVDIPLARGETHLIQSSITDQSGIGYVHLRVERIGPPATVYDPPVVFYDGPAVNRGSGSSADGSEGAPAYEWSYPLLVPSNTETLELYQATVTVFDIDGNSATSNATFVVTGGGTGGGGTGTGGGTGGGSDGLENGECEADWQCASHHCDAVRGICLVYPVITNVDPWNGATGNWITIEGASFGDTAGTVWFGADGEDVNNTVDDYEFTVLADVPQCSADIWRDSYIIAQVPDDVNLNVGSQSAIESARG